MKKITIISSGQPSLNPRLVKEADALADHGYDVTVLYAYWNEWGTIYDKELISKKKWKALRVGGDPSEKPFIYFISRAIYKLANTVNKISNGKLLAELAIARAGYFLIRAAKKQNADLYIGHNLGALAPTIKAAKTNKKPCGFDAEDFHRNELSNDIHNRDVILKARLEESYLPNVDYLTTSSAQIGEAYHQLFPAKQPVVIRNVFPADVEVEVSHVSETGPLRLLWFSQTIGASRGLDNLMDALRLLLHQSFQLHLLGDVSDDIKNKLLDRSIGEIHFHKPVPPDKLSLFASQYDIGLALEPGFSINNDMALSNKIFTYLQAGLAVIASDTSAQYDFMKQYPVIGKTFKKGDPASLAEVLSFYYQNRDVLFETRKASLKLVHEELNWEQESQKFLTQITLILDND